MARPKKLTVDYFPHFITTNSRTIFILESLYGNDGYTFWFKLLEMLGSTKGHCINANDVPDLEFLAAKTRVSGEKTLEILNKLSDLGAIDEELWTNHKVIWCQNFVDNLSDLYIKRKSPLPKKPIFNSLGVENLHLEEFTGGKPIENKVSGVINPQTKLNKTKSNKIKENKTKQEDIEEVVVVSDLSKVLSFYEQEIGLLSRTVMETFNFYLEEKLEPDLLIESIEIAVKNNKRRLSYIEGIVKNWLKDGTYTLHEYEIKELAKRRENNSSISEPCTDEMKRFLEEG